MKGQYKTKHHNVLCKYCGKLYSTRAGYHWLNLHEYRHTELQDKQEYIASDKRESEQK